MTKKKHYILNPTPKPEVVLPIVIEPEVKVAEVPKEYVVAVNNEWLSVWKPFATTAERSKALVVPLYDAERYASYLGNHRSRKTKVEEA